MARRRIEKKCIVDEFARKIGASSGIFLLRFSNLSAENANNFRRELSKIGSGYQVVKNRIFRLALLKTKLEQLQDMVDGPTAMAFVSEDPIVLAKKIYEFCKAHEGLEIRGGWFAGRLLTPSEVQEIANLPGRPVLLSRVITGMACPLYSLVNILKGNLTALVYMLDVISKKKSQR